MTFTVGGAAGESRLALQPIDCTDRFADRFIEHLWSGPRRPAKLYIQDAGFPVVLPYANDGTYWSAMSSEDTMDEFLGYMGQLIDDAANMDW